MSNVIIDESIESDLSNKFTSFLNEHSWDEKTKVACTYSFFHTLNLVNANVKLVGTQKAVFDGATADIKSGVIDEAIAAIRQCEVLPGNRLRLDSVVGSLLSLK